MKNEKIQPRLYAKDDCVSGNAAPLLGLACSPFLVDELEILFLELEG